MYRTLFGEAHPFSYDFEDLARYYVPYVVSVNYKFRRESFNCRRPPYDRLIAHWRAVLGEALHVVFYEDLVKESQRVGMALAHAYDVPWTDSAIAVQKNASESLTAGAAQIRRPIYGSSSGRWRHYRAYLDPLVRALRHSGVSLPDDA